MDRRELSRQAHVTVYYVWRLESAVAAPGIELLARLADALALRSTDLLPTSEPDPLPLLREQAVRLFGSLIKPSRVGCRRGRIFGYGFAGLCDRLSSFRQFANPRSPMAYRRTPLPKYAQRRVSEVVIAQALAI